MRSSLADGESEKLISEIEGLRGALSGHNRRAGSARRGKAAASETRAPDKASVAVESVHQAEHHLSFNLGRAGGPSLT
jgi:hypothetical protein